MSADAARIAAASLTLQLMEQQSAARARDSIARMWTGLGPKGLWDDALTVGAASQETMMAMSLMESMRRLGWSYAKTVATAMGANPASGLQPWLPNRLNTDPFSVALRTPDLYRHLGTQHTTVRPESFTDPDGGAQALRWLGAALADDWARLDRDAAQSAESSAVQQYRSAGWMTYMRVPHPAASRSGTCGLCVAASMRLYSTSHLMPLHDHCHCTVMPSGVRWRGRKVENLPLNASQDYFDDLSDADERLLHRVYVAANGGEMGRGRWDTSRGALSNVRMTADGTIRLHGKSEAVVGTNSEVGPVFSRPGTKRGEWHMPNRGDAERQLRQMAERSDRLDRLLRKAANGHRASGEVMGRHWDFSPGRGVNEAMRANEQLGRMARNRLRQLA